MDRLREFHGSKWSKPLHRMRACQSALHPCCADISPDPGSECLRSPFSRRSEKDYPGGKMTLKDRIAIVTGGGQGIGKEIAKKLSAAGAKVIIADINEEQVKQTAGELGI